MIFKMDWVSRIFAWLSEQEAGISAVVGIAVLAGIVFTGIRFVLSRRSQTTSEPTTKTPSDEDPLLALPTGPVVAVLPFENLSEDPKQEYFSDGLTDDIITALSRFKDLFVIARNSTFRYKHQPVDVRQLNKELGARYVLEGSVQRAESRLRVTAQLLDARDGTHLWAETYDRDLLPSNIFAVQDEISDQVVATIAGRFGVISRARSSEVREKPTDQLDAYEYVLKSGAYNRDNFDVTEHAKLRDGLENAVACDPNYADAWAYLCWTYLDEHRYKFNPRPNPLDRALEAARRAVAADTTSQEAREALAAAHFFRHELEAFFAEAERAIALNANHAATLASMGIFFLNAGDERGITFVRKAVALDPVHPTWFYFAIALHHLDRHEFEEALAAARKISIPRFYWTQIYLATIHAELGRQSEARSALEELRRIYPGFSISSLIEEWQIQNAPEDRIRRWAAALRKAGLPEA